MSSSTVRKFERILDAEKEQKSSAPVDSLESIAELALLSNSCGLRFVDDKNKNNDPTILSSQVDEISSHAKASLRTLYKHSFHGGAPESLRDKTFCCLLSMLNSKCKELGNWMIESEDSPGNFAFFICQVISIEFHLLNEEFLCIYEVSENSTRRRLPRNLTMFNICLSLLDHILILLVGNNEGETQQNETSSPSMAWSMINPELFVKIRGTTDTILNEIINLIKEISSIYQLTRSSEILSIVRRASMSLVRWVAEDENLFVPFLDILPSLLNCSLLQGQGQSKLVERLLIVNDPLVDKQLLENLLGKGDPCVDPTVFLDVKLSSSQLLNSFLLDMHSSDVNFGDVLLIILPTLLIISETFDADVTAGEDVDRKLKMGPSIAERLVSCTLLLPTLLKLVELVIRAVKEIDEKKLRENLYESMSMALDQVTFAVKWNSADLQLLAESEGFESIKSVLQCDYQLFLGVFSAVKQLTCLNMFKSKNKKKSLDSKWSKGYALNPLEMAMQSMKSFIQVTSFLDRNQDSG